MLAIIQIYTIKRAICFQQTNYKCTSIKKWNIDFNFS